MQDCYTGLGVACFTNAVFAPHNVFLMREECDSLLQPYLFIRLNQQISNTRPVRNAAEEPKKLLTVRVVRTGRNQFPVFVIVKRLQVWCISEGYPSFKLAWLPMLV